MNECMNVCITTLYFALKLPKVVFIICPTSFKKPPAELRHLEIDVAKRDKWMLLLLSSYISIIITTATKQHTSLFSHYFMIAKTETPP